MPNSEVNRSKHVLTNFDRPVKEHIGYKMLGHGLQGLSTCHCYFESQLAPVGKCHQHHSKWIGKELRLFGVIPKICKSQFEFIGQVGQ